MPMNLEYANVHDENAAIVRIPPLQTFPAEKHESTTDSKRCFTLRDVAGLPMGHVPRGLTAAFSEVIETGGSVCAEATGEPCPSFPPWPAPHETGGGAVIPCTYEIKNMFESRPELIKIFSSFQGKGLTELQHSGLIHAHALRVMATVDKCVSRLDDPKEVAIILREVGHNHKVNEVTFDQIKSILPHFLVATKLHIDSVWSDEVAEAWRCFFVLLIYHLTDGLES